MVQVRLQRSVTFKLTRSGGANERLNLRESSICASRISWFLVRTHQLYRGRHTFEQANHQLRCY